MGGLYEMTGSTIRKYYSIAGMTIAMKQDSGALQYLLTDHLGSVVAVTDSTGTLTSQQRYLPFGQVRSDVTSPNPQSNYTDFSYTGQRDVSGGLGLMDYHARMYDSMLGRFIQPDTIASPGSQGLNRFSYVQNNPVNATDPTGHVCNGFGHQGYAYKLCLSKYYSGSSTSGNSSQYDCSLLPNGTGSVALANDGTYTYCENGQLKISRSVPDSQGINIDGTMYYPTSTSYVTTYNLDASEAGYLAVSLSSGCNECNSQMGFEMEDLKGEGIVIVLGKIPVLGQVYHYLFELPDSAQQKELGFKIMDMVNGLPGPTTIIVKSNYAPKYGIDGPAVDVTVIQVITPKGSFTIKTAIWTGASIEGTIDYNILNH